MNKKAFVTGIQGQDGSTLARYLLSLGYEVHGLLRRNSIAEHQDSRISDLDIKTYYGDITDVSTLEKLLKEIQPNEIYNLAAMSHVKVSWDTPGYTLQTNGMGVLNILEAYRNACPTAKFYQASSSECFGLSVDEDQFQRESTDMNPTSVYGCSKVLGYNLVRHYRRAYGLFACNGILFNHTGIERSVAFAEAKIVKTACMIKLGLTDKLELGNLDSYRDFGASKDYVRAMHMILNHNEPDDFVVSTGETHSIREMCDYIFNRLNLDYKDYVSVNEKYIRPEELPFLRGDSTKIRETLGWKPEYTFESLFDEMIVHWLEKLKK
jgi:GDPmannose 4,6-dehydratase